MKAIVKQSFAAYDMALQELDMPIPGDREVLVQVHAVGICGTDLKIYQGHYDAYTPPVVPGHEFSGTIVAVGPGVSGFEIGTRITAHAPTTCGVCRSCIEGRENVCMHKTRTGFNDNGAFAQYVKVKTHQIHVLPEGMDLTQAALIEPLAVVVHALRHVQVKPSDTVLIIGPGSIGLLSLLLCKANGGTVVVSGLEKDHKRLLKAREMGADRIMHAEESGDEADLLARTAGEGADIVIECTGSPGGINQGLRLCRRGGRYVQVGTWHSEVAIDFMKIAYKEIEVSGSFSHTSSDWEESLRLLGQGKLDLSPLIAKTWSLEEWEKGFRALENGEELKVVFTP